MCSLSLSLHGEYLCSGVVVFPSCPLLNPPPLGCRMLEENSRLSVEIAQERQQRQHLQRELEQKSTAVQVNLLFCLSSWTFFF